MTWPNRFLVGTLAAIALVLSTILAGLHAGGRRASDTGSRLVAQASSATSSLSPGISSEQGAVGQVQQQVAAAADQAQAQQLQLAAAWIRAANARPPTPRPAPGPAPAPTVAALPADTGPGQRALAAAEAELGKPYRYAGAGPDSFDCSGLTMWAWRAAGVSLPHSATDQYDSTPHVATSSLQPGDLLYFGSSTSDIAHVAMYVSPGRMIEAEETGTVVSINPIRSGLVGASRP